ncbi:MAG: flagellar filament capping protein FliD [Archangium sp.]|nr:flagellar filament capping protein FliD [Archangium sp.]MDP3157980.1 flagellar filament capping protein FliD [Archangium sp.]MDP3574892.1 flagellar filament capping protein FliD [Archangium sp.]
MADSNFRVGGLASGLDTNSIIDQLVKIESNSVTVAQARQTAYQAQISQLGDLTSRLKTLASATDALKTGGALGLSQVGSTSGFTATPGSTATAGRFAMTVDTLATAAKARSAQFTSGSSQVTGGTLAISINGTSTDVAISDGMSLSQVAQAINDSGAGANAVVLESNGRAFLSITNTNTGFTPGQPPGSGMTITETSTGSLGQALGFTVTDATNAKVTIDGLQFERASNIITDALPGVTLNLKATTLVPEDLVLNTDTTATTTKLSTFVTAYNDVIKLLRQNLNIGEQIDRNKTLGGDSAVRALQSTLMGMVSNISNPGSAVRSLADLGLKTGTDATLTIDASRLEKALGTDPNAVNELFQKSTTGVAAKVKALVDGYTNSSDGILVSKSKSYDKSVKQIGTQIDSLQLRLEGYKKKLIGQFSAMEKIVSSFKSIGDYLTSQESRSKE